MHQGEPLPARLDAVRRADQHVDHGGVHERARRQVDEHVGVRRRLLEGVGQELTRAQIVLALERHDREAGDVVHDVDRPRVARRFWIMLMSCHQNPSINR